MGNIDGVLQVVLRTLGDSPTTLTLSAPKGGEGNAQVPLTTGH